MGWRTVQQPDDTYARFSDIVDDFTHMNMSREDAIEVCREQLGEVDAEYKVRRAELSPERWVDELNTIRLIHGDDTYQKRKKGICE